MLEYIRWEKQGSGEDILEHLRRSLGGSALINDIVEVGFRRDPEKTAIVYEAEKYSYRDFDDKSLKCANALREIGIKKGEKVALLMSNSPDYLFAYFGIIRSGAVVVSVNYRLAAPELQYVIGHSDSVALIMDNEYFDIIKKIKVNLPLLKILIVRQKSPSAPETLNLSELIENSHREALDLQLSEEDPVAMYYSSGTTGKPKGAIITQKNWAFTAETLGESLELQPYDIYLMVFPLFHIAFEYVIALIYISATIFVQKPFDVEAVLKGIEREKATIFWGTPAMYILMLNSPSFKEYDLSSLRMMMYAGAIMPVDIIKRLMNFITDADLLNGYGITECSGHCTFLPGELCYTKKGSVGKSNSFKGVTAKVVDDDGKPIAPKSVGEVLIKGPNIMKGYYKDQERTKEAIDINGWFHSGDLGMIDEEGYIYIVDRKKDMIVRGGENVYPAEIENVLFEHPAILEAAVIGIPHKVLGEDEKAFIVLKEGHHVTADEIIKYCRENLASYKVPRTIEFIKTLPRNAAGKVIKDKLREVGN